MSLSGIARRSIFSLGFRLILFLIALPVIVLCTGCPKSKTFKAPVAKKVAQYNVSTDMATCRMGQTITHCNVKDAWAAVPVWDVKAFYSCTPASIGPRIAPISPTYTGFYYVGHSWIPGCQTYSGLWFATATVPGIAYTGSASYDFVFLNSCRSALTPSLVLSTFNTPFVANNTAIGWDNLMTEGVGLTASMKFFAACKTMNILPAMAAANADVQAECAKDAVRFALDRYSDPSAGCTANGHVPQLVQIYGPGPTFPPRGL